MRQPTGARDGDVPHAVIPLAEYGLVGATRTAALLSAAGSVDCLCVPRFDGPPVFGRLVGGASAGSFRMGPAMAAPVV